MLEPDANDRELTREFFERDRRNISVEFLSYSHEVLPFLRSADALPMLIMLRINSVPETGLFVLTNLRSEKRFRQLPVIILGENTQPELVEKCYAAGANTVINKPFTFDQANLKINSFIQYWFNVAELPNRTPVASSSN